MFITESYFCVFSLYRLVNDPEKLLLPDSNESGCNSYLCDLENRIESSSLYGIELFKQSLSKRVLYNFVSQI